MLRLIRSAQTKYAQEYAFYERNARHLGKMSEWQQNVDILALKRAETRAMLGIEKPACLKGDITMEDWVWAAQYATIVCPSCKGTGQHRHGGDCFRCESKGYQNQGDFVRNFTYDHKAKTA